MGGPRVAVLGAGTMGAMAAWRLAERGAEVTAFDRFAPGHDRGAAGGESRIFRTVLKEGAEYVPLVRRALPLWRELEARTGRALLTLCGGLTVGPAGHPDLRAVRAVAAARDLDLTVLDPAEAARRFPQHPLAGDEVALLDPVAGVLRPEPAVLAAADAARRAGARIVPYTRVDDVAPVPDGVVLRAAGQTHRFDHVVLAPGPWASQLPTLGRLGVRTRQISTAWFPAHRPADWGTDRTPIVIRRGRTAAYSCFPCLDGVSVKISVHHRPWPPVPGPDGLPRTAHDDFLTAARGAVSELLPSLHPEPVRIGVYADAFTADGHPLLGPLPGTDRVTVLAGFSGHGFKLSPAAGDLAARQVLGEATADELPVADPGRVPPPAP